MAKLNDQQVEFGGKVFTLSPADHINYNGKPSIVWSVCYFKNGATIQAGQFVASARSAKRSAIEKFEALQGARVWV
jgi:hypothetical protein